MDADDAISISSTDSVDPEDYSQRRAILEPAIRNVVESLGGFEGGSYRMGDEAYGCLKDLKKYWRKDDTDDERTVARIFWATQVLSNDLIPILLETAGKGYAEDKRSIACVDLMTAMTWPIDLAEELKELDDELDRGTDYTELLHSHLNYKSALLAPGVLKSIFNIMLPCLSKDKRERKERDVQIINVVLHLVRNLAFIKDLPANIHLSSDQADFSSLQGKLIKTLSETHYLDLLLTVASNADTDVMFNGWNTLVLEIFYLLFRGVKPNTLIMEQTTQVTKNLHSLLSIEDKRRRDFARHAPSRHSRFGTTISVKLNPKKSAAPPKPTNEAEAGEPAPPAAASSSSSSQPLVLHRQQALNKEAGTIIDLVKRQKTQKGKKIDDLGRDDNLSTGAKTVLQGLARTFIESCFNPFLASLLKDIKSERPKITDKDNLRLLYVTKWFLEFFLAARANDKGNDKRWEFGLVGEVIERGWIVWVLKRMRGAVEEKPKLWTELQAGMECLTHLLVLIESMSSSSESASASGSVSSLQEAAELLQQQLIYNGEAIDAALDGLRTYAEGRQTISFLHAGVNLAYRLMKMLEQWGKKKGEGAYVRKRAKPKRKRKTTGRGTGEEEGVPDVEEEEEAPAEEEEFIHETMFTFEAFEMKFANPDITTSLLTYLGRYDEFESSENMRRIVSLIHRQVVRAKAEGLYFQVSTLELFKFILANQKSLPKEQPYKDLITLINYILRQFFKAVEEDSFVLVEAFFPKNRGRWKRLSSWEPEPKLKKARAPAEDARFPPDVQVKKGYTWSEQLAIAMAALQENGDGGLIEWVKDILSMVIAHRKRIIEDTDGADSDQNAVAADMDDEELKAKLLAKGPSSEALSKMTDYAIPYISDEQADAATKNPQLKLMFRLANFYIVDKDARQLEWHIPAGILLSDLERSLAVIAQFQHAPLDLGGKRAAQLLGKKTRRRRRRRLRRDGSPSSASGSDGSDGGGDDDDDEPKKRKRERKRKEKEVYKSAQFIEDSDDEFAKDIDEFFERERALRERTALAAANSTLGIGTTKKTGTKRRRKPLGERAGAAKRRKASGGARSSDEGGADAGDERAGPSTSRSRSPSHATPPPTPPAAVDAPHARPRPRPRARPKPTPTPTPRIAGSADGDADGDRTGMPVAPPPPLPRSSANALDTPTATADAPARVAAAAATSAASISAAEMDLISASRLRAREDDATSDFEFRTRDLGRGGGAAEMEGDADDGSGSGSEPGSVGAGAAGTAGGRIAGSAPRASKRKGRGRLIISDGE